MSEKVIRAKIAVFTPKAYRVEKLRGQGKSFDEAFAIADREYTSDGLSVRHVDPETKHNVILSSGLAQMGEVQF